MIQSFSESLLSNLTVWRNPQGAEENWFQLPEDAEPIDPENELLGPGVGRVVTTEICAALLTVTATVEFVVAIVFAILLLPTTLFTEEICGTLLCHMDSAFMTIHWAGSTLSYNLFENNIHTALPFHMRHKMGENVYGARGAYLDNWQNAHRPAAVPSVNNDLGKDDITLGAELISNVLLKDVDEATKEEFVEMGVVHEPFNFVITKAIYLYVLGTRSKLTIPGYFNKTTQEGIELLRYGIGIHHRDEIPSDLKNETQLEILRIREIARKMGKDFPNIVKGLKERFKSIESFERADSKDVEAEKVALFNHENALIAALRTVAYPETQNMQKCILLSECYKKAVAGMSTS